MRFGECRAAAAFRSITVENELAEMHFTKNGSGTAYRSIKKPLGGQEAGKCLNAQAL